MNLKEFPSQAVQLHRSGVSPAALQPEQPSGSTEISQDTFQHVERSLRIAKQKRQGREEGGWRGKCQPAGHTGQLFVAYAV